MERQFQIDVVWMCDFYMLCRLTSMFTLFLIFFIITLHFSYVFISIILYSILLILINLPLKKIKCQCTVLCGLKFSNLIVPRRKHLQNY